MGNTATVSITLQMTYTDYETVSLCCVVDAIEQRDGKHPLKELEQKTLKPYKRRYKFDSDSTFCTSQFLSRLTHFITVFLVSRNHTL